MTSTPAAIPEPPLASLLHIPGTDGWPLVGNTLQMLADPKGPAERFAEKYGLVYRSHMLGGRTITLLGPEANEFVLLDPGKLFSSTYGWARVFELLFPRGLLLLDFEEHRLHRKALSVAFKGDAMKSYLESFNRGVESALICWMKSSSPNLRFYPAIKRTTLDLAAVCFLGAEMGADLEAIKRAFIDMIAAAVSVVRSPIPGTQMYRGVKSRQFLIDCFARQIDIRRAGEGADIFTQLCRATIDDGALLSPRDIIEDMSFLMMAAHDTLASSLTSLVYFLAVNRWQEKLREEVQGLRLGKGEPLPYEKLDELPLTEMAFKEALRLIPPVPSIPRGAMRDTEFAGFRIPAGARVNINPLHTHHMPALWPEPEKFDPLRFTGEATRARHKYAFVPFGGGAHMRLGMHFVYMQAKCFAYHLLMTAAISAPANYRPEWRYWPIPQPRDGLQVKLTALR